ncbi:MAG: hypothetical protein GY795_09260 [Desulfobacterales bacterium]|nr:hypothetical protein [Desulfobacterales bacterium]
MCGIVGYFGGAGNNLTRVLTGMSAIIYRAPDSTGVGFFGDDLEPVRVRKSLGSVAKLSETLLNDAAYPNQAEKLMSLWTLGQASDIFKTSEMFLPVHERQRRLLEFEGLPLDIYESLLQGHRKYPSFDDLVEVREFTPVRLTPGWPGRPGPIPAFSVRSAKNLKKTIYELTIQYDLSYVVIQSLIRKALSDTLAREEQKKPLEIDLSDILSALDQVLEKTFLEEKKTKPVRLNYGWAQRNPYAERYLWRYLKESRIQVPEDYDRDGVRCVFRLLDAALLCQAPLKPDLHIKLQRILEILWSDARRISNTDWRTLYWAEKGLNVYGWAAASALTCLKREELLPELLKTVSKDQLMTEQSVIPGETDPVSLRFFSQPVISHGRWALQASVTIKNSHPFFDALKHRTIVLNGQFSGETEAEARDFLEQVGKMFFRSENSSEFFSLLWGYYFENLIGEQKRYEAVGRQLDAGLEAYNIGSQTIDYQVYQKIKGKTPAQLDEFAFLEAVRRMAGGGGQVAVTGISLYSPRRLYIASHNRPAFIVKRMKFNEYMIVSDINAAMGLFPQKLVHQKTVEINKLRKELASVLTDLRGCGGDKKSADRLKKEYRAEENAILEAFRVIVYPLDGEEIFARIETGFEYGSLKRKLEITDFDGNLLPDIEPFSTVLSPEHIKKDLFGSFYETHLHEIPDRLDDILRFYIPEEESLPVFDIRKRFLHRRFGDRFVGLKRIVIVGMGSSYNAGLMASKFFREIMPEKDVLVVRPVEIEDISRFIVPEKDLVILLSWSSTTADMVEFAKDLMDKHVVMTGITEKVFADMALTASRSGGVIPVLSGEEITISGIKSIVCTLFCLDLFAVWLASNMGINLEEQNYVEKLRRLPELISQILDDETIKEFSGTLASEKARACAAVVLGDLNCTGTCREIALKIEENTWTVIGKPLDYSDSFFPFRLNFGASEQDKYLVLVNATSKAHLGDALDVMKKLYIAGIPFAVVSYDNLDLPEIEFYSQNQPFLLPKIDDTLQPFVDLAFYYQFVFQYARAHGRKADDFPRNRVKSVTAGRSRPKKSLSPAAELQKLKFETGELKPETGDSEQVSSLWESSSSCEWEKNYYQQILRLAKIFHEEDPLGMLLKSGPGNLEKLGAAIFEDITQEGEIIIVPLDRASEPAARNTAYEWSRLMGCSVRVSFPRHSIFRFPEDALVVFLGSSSYRFPDSRFQCSNPCLWLGPELPDTLANVFCQSLGYFVLQDDFTNIETDVLYAALCFIFINAWKTKAPEKSAILENYFRQAREIVTNILNDGSLKNNISETMAENCGYKKGFFLGPGGTGSAWMNTFDQTQTLAFQWHPFGESAHGALATVDYQVDAKYIRIEGRSRMISLYGEDQVINWENRYLAGENIDVFLDRYSEDIHAGYEIRLLAGPFFAEGCWYLPVLQDGYDTERDNLIIIDAASPRYFAQALDELATYGCRHARMIVIAQNTNGGQISPRLFPLAKYPISRLILLPCPVSDFLLPFAMNILGTAMAVAASDVRKLAFEPASEGSLVQQAFGNIGKAMIRHRIDISYMNHYLIELLKNVAPLVTDVEGVARYAVRTVENEDELLVLASEGRLYSPDDTASNFRYSKETSGAPFYLVHPEQGGFEGKAGDFAGQIFPEQYWEMWTEPFGNTWKVLNYRILGIQETSEKEPLVMVPLIGARKIGYLFYFYVRFSEWDHSSGFEDQLQVTVKALGKDIHFHEYISPRYLKIASRFNDETASQGYIWDDRFLVLVKRSLLFYKPSREISALLAQRVTGLLDTERPDGSRVTTEEISGFLEKTWESLHGIEEKEDGERWEILRDRLAELLL